MNFILFDDNLQILDAGWQRVPVEAGFDPGEEGLPGMHRKGEFPDAVTASSTGYIYIWVSNESENVRVWFDDLKITHSTSIVTQATDYGVWGDVLREQKSNLSDNYRFGYQGQYSERDEETSWNHFELREYDPIVGRWTVTDPKRQFFSPYVGMGNNPIKGIDPDGGGVLDIIFQNNSGDELGRIVTSGPDEIIKVDTDIKLDKPIVINPAELLSKVDAVGFGIEASFTLGGGMNGGFEWVYFLNGPDKGNLFSYGKLGGNLGLEGGADVYGFFAYSNDSPGNMTKTSCEGMFNSYSGGYGWLSGGYFWGNKEGTSELYPGHKGKTTWEGWQIMGAYSPGFKLGGKWSSTKYTLLSD